MEICPAANQRATGVAYLFLVLQQVVKQVYRAYPEQLTGYLLVSYFIKKIFGIFQFLHKLTNDFNHSR